MAARRAASEHVAVRLVVALLVCMPGIAGADRHVIQRGETLEHVAAAYGCSVDEVMRANRVDTTLLPAGRVIDIPKCSLRSRAQTRLRTTRSRVRDDEDKARAALAVIDGATWIDATRPAPARAVQRIGPQLPRGEGYLVRRPQHAYGADHVVGHLRRVIAEVRALYPEVHTLAIGDLSAPHGGTLRGHRSHQRGLDVDVGFYFQRMPAGYPERFAAADDTIDLRATWALLTAFARTADLDDGVAVMFLDYTLQRRLYTWAYERGTPEEDLAVLFQYPRGKDAQVGLIRHWPNHADHVHVRFKPARQSRRHE